MEAYPTWNDRIINCNDMIQEVDKLPKIALCRKSRGTGKVQDPETLEYEVCDQCEGSGRVTVSAKMILDIRPYHPKSNNL